MKVKQRMNNATTTILDLLSSATTKLNFSPTPRLDAEILLCDVLECNRAFLSANPDLNIDKKQIGKFEEFLSRRRNAEPVAYITNEKWFYGNKFYVDNSVLIPRPETELLVEEALRIINKQQPAVFVDVGTGSGCIILSIAKNIAKRNAALANKMRWIATDISEEALDVARKNYEETRKMDNFPRIKFKKGNLIQNIEKVDLIVSNPPYISEGEISRLDVNVRNYEPHRALRGGLQGFEVTEELFKQARSKLSKKGSIVLEVHSPQSKKVLKIAGKYFPSAKITMQKDYAGLDRILTISLN